MSSMPVAEKVRIGTAGWSIPPVASQTFAAEGTHLQRYAQIFNACEINSSFYRPHKPQTWERWAASVPADFQFSVKAPRAITHEAALNCSVESLTAFLGQLAFLRNKLGPILFQLPPSLECSIPQARDFLSLLREKYQGEVVWEPRHRTWFDGRAEALLREFHVARVAADPACVPEAAQPGGFSELLYFRLHGSPRKYYSSYGGEVLNGLARQFAGLSPGTKAWCIFDNTAAGFAISNALTLRDTLKQTLE